MAAEQENESKNGREKQTELREQERDAERRETERVESEARWRRDHTNADKENTDVDMDEGRDENIEMPENPKDAHAETVCCSS